MFGTPKSLLRRCLRVQTPTQLVFGCLGIYCKCLYILKCQKKVCWTICVFVNLWGGLMVYRFLSLTITLLGTLLKILFLFQRWDMLVPSSSIDGDSSILKCFWILFLGFQTEHLRSVDACHSPGASDARFETTCVRCWETQSDCWWRKILSYPVW